MPQNGLTTSQVLPACPVVGRVKCNWAWLAAVLTVAFAKLLLSPLRREYVMLVILVLRSLLASSLLKYVGLRSNVPSSSCRPNLTWLRSETWSSATEIRKKFKIWQAKAKVFMHILLCFATYYCHNYHSKQKSPAPPSYRFPPRWRIACAKVQTGQLVSSPWVRDKSFGGGKGGRK